MVQPKNTFSSKEGEPAAEISLGTYTPLLGKPKMSLCIFRVMLRQGRKPGVEMEGYQKDQSCPPRLQRDTTVLESGRRGKGETAADSGKTDRGGMSERFPQYPPQGLRIPGPSGALIAETQRPAEQNRPRCRSLANHLYPAPAPDFSETVFLWLPDCGQTLGTRGLSLAITAADGRGH